MLEEVSLGHEFVTDVLKLKLHPKPGENMEPIWFAHSLAYALVEGAAEVLDFPPTDLNATVAHSSEQYSLRQRTRWGRSGRPARGERGVPGLLRGGPEKS